MLPKQEQNERNKQIIALYESGKSLSEVCQAMDNVLTRQAIYLILKKNNVNIRSKTEALRGYKSNIDEKELRRLFLDEKLTRVEIAKHFGVSMASVYHYLDKFNLSRAKEDDSFARRRGRKTQQLTKEVLLKEIQSGKSQEKIADTYDTSQPNISRMIRDYEIDVRTVRAESKSGN